MCFTPNPRWQVFRLHWGGSPIWVAMPKAGGPPVSFHTWGAAYAYADQMARS